MSTASEVTRMSGLMSGLDTESLIKAATANTKSAINARKQKLQTLQWKQEAYRGVITAMSEFQSKYLDIISKDSIRANSVMKANKAESSNDKLSVAASASAVAAKYSITSVQTAKAAKIEGTKASSGSVALNFAGAASGENTVSVTLDGTTRKITFSGGADYAETQDNFLTALNDAFDGVSSAKFSFMDGTSKLMINNASGDKVSHIFTVGYNEAVGLKNDSSNMISSSATIGSLDFAQRLDGNSYKFSINGKEFSFTGDTTIKDMMNTINKSDAGVKMSFSGLTQAFTLETTGTGAGQEISISQNSGNLLNALFNISGDELGTTPTIAKGLTNKMVDDTVKFEFTASKSGLASGDNIIINGKALSVTGLTQTQKSEKITVNGSSVTALKYTNASGADIYKYSENGVTHYATSDGSGYTDMMTVESGKVYVNGLEIEGVTEADQLSNMSITKQMQSYSASDYADALNDAYKASFPEGKGSFSVQIFDDTADAVITFTPGADEITAAAVTGSISLADTGHGSDGVFTNYSEAPYPDSYEITKDKKITFALNNSSEITINGTGTDGAVTIKDLTDSGYFNYDDTTGTLSVAGKNKLDVLDGGVFDIHELFGTTSLVGEDNVGTKTINGSNAQITINGVTLESASNTFSIDGTTFGIEDVKEFTEDDIANGDAEEITVNVSKDNSKIKDTILGFVEAYNKLLDTINEQLSTSRPKSDGDYYDPLTEEQEEEMEQDEIDKWNEQAKKGLLYHDSTLSKVFNQIRTAINASVGGMTIQSLGIDTSDDYTEYGKLEIKDESVLDSAIERYGDEIAEFFTDTQKGLGASLNNAVKAAIDTSTNSNGYPKGILTSVAGVENTRSAQKNMLYTQISNMQTIIERLNTRYESQQERLWKQYTTLETYINTMSSQSSSLFGTSSTTGY